MKDHPPQNAARSIDLPCPRCRRGECEQPSGRYVVKATYEVVVVAHSIEEAWDIADDAKYDHRAESMRMLPDSAEVAWPDDERERRCHGYPTCQLPFGHLLPHKPLREVRRGI